MSNCKCKAKPCVKCGNCSRCCQHATHKKNRPPLNCKCKVMRCPACDLCSSCCQHGSRRRSIVKRFKWNAARSKANKKLLFDLCMLVGVYDALKNKKVPQGKRGAILESKAADCIFKRVRYLPSAQNRSKINELKNEQKCRLTNLLQIAVKCVVKAFIPIGDIGLACEHIAHYLMSFSRSSSFILESQKDAIINDMATVCSKLPPSNLQRRALLAILSQNLSKDQMLGIRNRYQIQNDEDDEDEIEDLEAKLTVSKRQISTAKIDSKLLLGGKELTKSIVPRAKKSPKASQSVVSFLLNKDTINFLSWGNSKVKISTPSGSQKMHIIPALNRTRHICQLFSEYDLIHQNTHPKDRVGRSSFFAIAGQLTAKEQRRRSGVYEFANQHGFQNFKRIKMLISTIAEIDGSGVDQNFWHLRSNALEAFLRQNFKNHVRSSVDPKPEEIFEIDDDGLFLHPKEDVDQFEVCCAHSLLYSLGFAPENSVSITTGCSECAGTMSFFKELQNHLDSLPSTVTPSVREGLEIRLASCESSVKKYMAHQIRTINQADRIDNMCKNLEPDQGMLTVDFKMKYTPMMFRESQQNYFGKRGMAWHGSMLIYCDPNASNEETEEKEKRVHYFEQIIENDTVQDFTSVACCLESAIQCIQKQFPFLKRLILISDNAKCYSGSGLLGVIVALSVTSGIKIDRIVHGEAGEGKSELDAHFGCAYAWLERYVNAGHDVLKPKDVVEGLRSYGGIPNSSAHLLTFNVNCVPSESEEETSEESDSELLIEAPKGRSTSPLSSFLSELKPKLKGNITEIRDVEIDFDESDKPIKLICRSYTGFSTSEVLGVQYVTSHPRVVPSASLTYVKTTSPADVRSNNHFRNTNKSNAANIENNETMDNDGTNRDEIELLEMAGYDRCQECRRFFHNIRKHRCKGALSTSLLPQTLMLGIKEIEEKRLGTPDLYLLLPKEQAVSTEIIPVGFSRGWAARPKRAERGQGGVSKSMMSELEKMFETGETGRSKMSPAQAAEKLELMKNPDGSLKFPIIPDLCKIMAAFSAFKKKKTNSLKAVPEGQQNSTATSIQIAAQDMNSPRRQSETSTACSSNPSKAPESRNNSAKRKSRDAVSNDAVDELPKKRKAQICSICGQPRKGHKCTGSKK